MCVHVSVCVCTSMSVHVRVYVCCGGGGRNCQQKGTQVGLVDRHACTLNIRTQVDKYTVHVHCTYARTHARAVDITTPWNLLRHAPITSQYLSHTTWIAITLTQTILLRLQPPYLAYAVPLSRLATCVNVAMWLELSQL